MSIDINAAKQYNEALKQARANASQLEAERAFIRKEIDTLCTELSAEIGENVTIENVESVLEKYAAKIESTVNTGNIVLAKIQTELANSAQAATASPQMNVQQQAVEVQQSAPVAPAVDTPVQNVQAVQVTPAATPSQPVGFNNNVVAPVDGGSLPPLFKLG